MKRAVTYPAKGRTMSDADQIDQLIRSVHATIAWGEKVKENFNEIISELKRAMEEAREAERRWFASFAQPGQAQRRGGAACVN
jgi:hypothetical protein